MVKSHAQCSETPVSRKIERHGYLEDLVIAHALLILKLRLQHHYIEALEERTEVTVSGKPGLLGTQQHSSSRVGVFKAAGARVFQPSRWQAVRFLFLLLILYGFSTRCSSF